MINPPNGDEQLFWAVGIGINDATIRMTIGGFAFDQVSQTNFGRKTAEANP